MQDKTSNKKISTIFDFEGVNSNFEDILAELEAGDDNNPGNPDHFFLWIEPWTEYQLTDFNNIVWDSAEELCHTLIGNNLKYNSAYWWLRKACKERYGDAGIPHFVHAFEKALRTQTPGDNEDSELDKVGYELLEYVCRKLEKKWDEESEAEAEDEISLMSDLMDEPDPEQCSESDLIENIPVKKRLCYHCGEVLTGKQRKYCSIKCKDGFRNNAYKTAVMTYKQG